jgi:FAM177 family
MNRRNPPGMWLFEIVLGGVEYVGSIVATFLGMNESKYQYVLDQMTEEDWKKAREIHAQRELQSSYRRDDHPLREVDTLESQSQPAINQI